MKNLRKQFNEISKLIDQNINSIADLIEQSKNLEKVISGDVSSIPNETKEKLTTIKNSIDQSIDNLMDHIKDLFETYDDVIEVLYSERIAS